MIVKNSDDLAGGKDIRKQPACVMGNTQTGKDRTANMIGIVRAKRAAAVQSDLPTLGRKIPTDDMALMDIANTLVGP